MSKKNSILKKTNANAKWLPTVLLPILLNGMAMADDSVINMSAIEKKETTLPDVKVKATFDKKSSGYRTGISTAGAKTDTPLLETPQSVSVITDARMEAQNVSTLAEALRYTPGIQSESFGFEPRMTYLKLRGFDATTNGLYRDGLKLNNPGYAVGYSLEPYGAERMEVPRGPASVLYGQASPGGLVNYVSKRPSFDPLREIKFEAGTFGRLQGELDVSGAFDESESAIIHID